MNMHKRRLKKLKKELKEDVEQYGERVEVVHRGPYTMVHIRINDSHDGIPYNGYGFSKFNPNDRESENQGLKYDERRGELIALGRAAKDVVRNMGSLAYGVMTVEERRERFFNGAG